MDDKTAIKDIKFIYSSLKKDLVGSFSNSIKEGVQKK